LDFADGEEFTPDNPKPSGEGWTIPGLEEDLGELRVHPVHLVEPEAEFLFDLWFERRERRSLPDPGGILQQAAKTLEAFAVIDDAVAAIRRTKGGKAKG